MNTPVEILRELYTRFKKPFLVIILVLVSIWLVILLLTHGIIDSSEIKPGNKIVLIKQGGDTIEIEPGRKLIPTGVYSVMITPENSTNTYRETVVVKNFLRTTKVKFESKPQAAAKILDPVTSNTFLQTNSGELVSFVGHDFVINNDSQPQSPPYFDTCTVICVSLLPYQKSTLLAYYTFEDKYIEVNSVSIENKSVTPIKNHSTHHIDSTIHTNTRDGSFAVYSNKNTIYHYDSIDAEPTVIKLDSPVAHGIDDMLIATNKKSTMVVVGNNFLGPESGDGGSSRSGDEKSDFLIEIYDNKSGKKTSSKTLVNHFAIANISLSPDAKHFTINTLGGFELYRVGSYEKLFFEPQSPSSSVEVEWLNSNSFFYTNGINSINLGTTTGSSYTIFSSSHINISSYRYINNKIYATGFFTDYTDTKPMAILIDPSSPEVSNKLIQRGPLTETSNYSIEFDGETFFIYRAFDFKEMKSIDSDLSSAYSYINKLVKNPKIIVIE